MKVLPLIVYSLMTLAVGLWSPVAFFAGQTASPPTLVRLRGLLCPGSSAGGLAGLPAGGVGPGSGHGVSPCWQRKQRRCFLPVGETG